MLEEVILQVGVETLWSDNWRGLR